MYQSDFTKFINGYLEKNQEVSDSRLRLRATWWDKPQSLQTQAENDDAAVAKPAYAYFPTPKKTD
jgi:hypothetical protein